MPITPGNRNVSSDDEVYTVEMQVPSKEEVEEEVKEGNVSLFDLSRDNSESEVDQLKSDIRYLQNELSLAVEDKVRAAEYGLQLLEEKEELQTRVEILEKESEKAQQEIKNVSLALERCRLVTKHLAAEEENYEERIQEETERITDQWRSTLIELEAELRRLRKLSFHKDDIIAENERLKIANKDLTEKAESLKQKVSEMKEEVEHQRWKLRDYEELEERFISLQGQMSLLKSPQKELQQLRKENAGLSYEIEALTNEIKRLQVENQRLENQLNQTMSSLEEEQLNNLVNSHSDHQHWKNESLFDELKNLSNDSGTQSDSVFQNGCVLVDYDTSDTDHDDSLHLPKAEEVHTERAVELCNVSQEKVAVLKSKPLQIPFYTFSSPVKENENVIESQDIKQPSYSKVNCLLGELEQHFLAIANENSVSYDPAQLTDTLVQADFEVEGQEGAAPPCNGCLQLEDHKEHFSNLDKELVKINETLSQFYQQMRIANKERNKAKRNSGEFEKELEQADSACDDMDIRHHHERADSAFDSLDDPDSQSSDAELDTTLVAGRPESPRRQRDVLYECEFYVEQDYKLLSSENYRPLSKLDKSNPCYNSIEKVYQNLDKLKTAIEVSTEDEGQDVQKNRRKSSEGELEEFTERTTTVKRVEYRCQCHDELICEEIHNVTDSSQLKKKLIKTEYVTL